MVDVVGDVLVDRAQQRQPASRPQQLGVDPVTPAWPCLVDELLHADVVGLGRLLEIALERVASSLLDGVEQRQLALAVRRHRRRVPVLPEDLVVGIEPCQLVVLLRLAAEPTEEPLEGIGHQIPGGAGIESEALTVDPVGHPTQALVLFEDAHIRPGIGKMTGRREPAEPGSDDHHTFVRKRL